MHSFPSEVVLRPSPLHSKALVSDARSSLFLWAGAVAARNTGVGAARAAGATAYNI